MMRKVLLLALIAVSGFLNSGKISANTYGLRLLSHDFSGKERTTLLLNEGNAIETGDKLTLKFRMSVRDIAVFGNIVTLYGSQEQQLDYKIVLSGGNDTFQPTLIVGGQLFKIDYLLNGHNPLDDIPMSMTLDRKANKVTVGFGSRERTCNVDLSSFGGVTIAFGSQLFHNGSADAAPIDIWNVEVERNGKPLYYWELRNHTGYKSIDKQNGAVATATNGHWLQDDHTTWERVLEVKSATQLQYAFNSRNSTFYILDDDSIMTWNVATGEQRVRPLKGYRLNCVSKYLYVNEQRDELYSYALGKRLVARLDPNTLAWDRHEAYEDDAAHYDHAQVSLGGDTLYAFGGYGFYRWHNDLYRINTLSKEVEQLTYEPLISPRVSMAATQVGQKIYIFGGYGNEEGKQELPRKFYNDLWEIDLTTMKATKLWQSESKEEFTLASTMVYDEDQQAFYAVAFYTGGVKRCLLKVWLKKPYWQAVTEDIPFDPEYYAINFCLYKSDALQKMYAVADRMTDSENHHLEIFSVDLPIIDDAIIGYEEESSDSHIFMTVLAVLFLGLAIASIFWMRRRQKVASPAVLVTPVENMTPTEAAEPIAPVTKYYDQSGSTIQMLGELKVTNRVGEDITSKFTRRTRNLFILVMLYSASKERGVEIRTLDEALWQEMDEESARNNRNVYMRKLRVLLEEVGQVEIANDKIYYKAEIGKDVLFDYQETLRLMNRMETSYDDELTARTLELLLRGPLLPAMSTEWLDDFKGDFSSRVIKLLSRLERQAIDKGKLDLAYSIAETIMRHDPFSEEALASQCSILCKKKTVGIAKNVYDRFCKNYEQAMGEPYGVSFSEVCKKQ